MCCRVPFPMIRLPVCVELPNKLCMQVEGKLEPVRYFASC